MTQSVLRAGKARAEERKLDRSVAAAAVALGLSAHLDNRIKDLPYGTQKRVDLARAFVGGAQLLLLDEPAAGMNDDEIADIEGALRQLRSVTELGMLLIEHHVEFVSRFTDRLYVLDAGRVIASGAPEAVLALPEVIEAYIGGAIED